MDISFISYDGVYPNLCSGVLVLKVNGEERKFGYSEGMSKPFWCSGGRGYFSFDWSEAHIYQGDWTVDEYELPDDLRPYAKEIVDIINENIEHGCCGGCI